MYNCPNMANILTICLQQCTRNKFGLNFSWTKFQRSCLALTRNFDMTQRIFFLYSALKRLSKAKFSLERQTRRHTVHISESLIENQLRHETQEIYIKESVYKQVYTCSKSVPKAQEWRKGHSSYYFIAKFEQSCIHSKLAIKR